MKSAAAALLAGFLLAGGVAAQQQQNADVLVTGTLIQSGPFGYDENTTMTCRGIPTCTGEYRAHVREENCVNYLDSTGSVLFTGLNLTQSGTLQGTMRSSSPNLVRNTATGICTHTGQITTESASFTGTWNLATKRGTLHVVFAPGDEFDMNFTADLTATAPVFPMTVTARIGPDTSTVSASIQFRPQDVGKIGSVFVFASAPASRVQGGLLAKAVHTGLASTSTKADPVPCVLAQMSGGQLVAVTTSQLAAFTTGAFSAAGTAVSILNNTPTPGIAGATFYVGYGANGGAMIDEGIYRNAALIPGNSVCPMLPYMTSLWYNPAESGWGINVSHQGNIAFATLFTYDASRTPMWLVLPAGTLQPDGLTFTGDLYRTTGPVFNANPFTPIGPANISSVGTMSLSFTEANAGVLNYTVNGVAVQKAIQRQVFGSRASTCLPSSDSRVTSTNYQDLWWNAAESGWGLNITHQDNTFFATLFTYDSANRGLWLVLPAGVRQGDGSYFGELYRTSGPPFNAAPFTPISGNDITSVGNMRLRFTDGNNGTLSYTYSGTTVNKAITRQVFSSPQSACN